MDLLRWISVHQLDAFMIALIVATIVIVVFAQWVLRAEEEHPEGEGDQRTSSYPGDELYPFPGIKYNPSTGLPMAGVGIDVSGYAVGEDPLCPDSCRPRDAGF